MACDRHVIADRLPCLIADGRYVHLWAAFWSAPWIICAIALLLLLRCVGGRRLLPAAVGRCRALAARGREACRGNAAPAEPTLL